METRKAVGKDSATLSWGSRARSSPSAAGSRVSQSTLWRLTRTVACCTCTPRTKCEEEDKDSALVEYKHHTEKLGLRAGFRPPRTRPKPLPACSTQRRIPFARLRNARCRLRRQACSQDLPRWHKPHRACPSRCGETQSRPQAGSRLSDAAARCASALIPSE